MEDFMTAFRPRVNGNMLLSHRGKPICLLGRVLQVASNGKSFVIQTSDKQRVTVEMFSPLVELIDGMIEIQGVVTQRNTVICRHYVLFPDQDPEKFSMPLYNSAVELLASHPEHYFRL